MVSFFDVTNRLMNMSIKCIEFLLKGMFCTFPEILAHSFYFFGNPFFAICKFLIIRNWKNNWGILNRYLFIRVGISSHCLGMWEFLDIDLSIAIKDLMHSNPFQFWRNSWTFCYWRHHFNQLIDHFFILLKQPTAQSIVWKKNPLNRSSL